MLLFTRQCRLVLLFTKKWVIFSSSNDHSRKRPLIVYDGSSPHTGVLKVKKPEDLSTTSATGITDRLKPPPAANLSNPIRRLSGSTSSTSSSSLHHSNSNLKREANGSVGSFPLLPDKTSSICCQFFLLFECTLECLLMFIIFFFRTPWNLQRWRKRSNMWRGPDP